MIIHYVYYSYEPYGRGYIGKHKLDLSTGLTPKTDNYYGSFLDKSFRPTKKIILEIFHTESEAYETERIYQELFDVIHNINFANRSIQKSTGFYFDRTGISHDESTKKRISDTMKKKRQNPESVEKYSKIFDGVKNPNYGKCNRFDWINEHTQVIEYNSCPNHLAKKHNLCISSISRVSKSAHKVYKGWRVYHANQKPSVNSKVYEGSETSEL